MSMCRGNEGGSVWVCFFPNIFHKFLPLFELPSKYCGLQLYLCKQKGPFNLFSVICGIVPEGDNQVWSLQCKHHMLSSRPLQGHLCTKICFLVQPKSDSRKGPGGADPSPGSAEVTPATGTLPHHWIDLVYNLSACSQSHQKIPGNAGTWRSRGRGKADEQQGEGEEWVQSKNEIKSYVFISF